MFDIYNISCGCNHSGDFILNRPNGGNGYLMLFVKTRAVFHTEEGEIITKPGTFIIYDKGAPQHYHAIDDIYINDWAEFDTTEIDDMDIRFNTPIYTGDSINVSAYFQLITDCVYKNRDHRASGYLIKAMLLEIFTQESVEGNYANITDAGVHLRRLLELRKEIYASPEKEWSVENMAEIINVSVSYVHKLYKKVFGITCTKDVIKSRISRAKEYLSGTGMTIEEISEKCGYSSIMHFSRQFHSVTGQTPSQFRK